MTLTTLLRLCKAYRDLGDAVAEQVIAIDNGDSAANQNANALRLADEQFMSEVTRLAQNDADLLSEVQDWRENAGLA